MLGYIDPGTGSALLAAIVGSVLAVGVAIKVFWYKIVAFFKKPFGPSRRRKP